jgi:hypothetical protein
MRLGVVAIGGSTHRRLPDDFRTLQVSIEFLKLPLGGAVVWIHGTAGTTLSTR